MIRLIALSWLLLGTAAAAQEIEISVYSGIQTSPHSGITGEDPTRAGDTSLDFNAGWEGRSGEVPPYYGIRATRWLGNGWGIAGEFNHAKVYADDETLAESGFSRLELTYGLNLITINAMRRYTQAWGKYTPYWGAGEGLAVPHVDVETPGGQRTFGYQITGPAVVWMAGVSRPFGDSFAWFAEYKGSYSINDIELEGGGNLQTNIITNAVNLGLSWSF